MTIIERQRVLDAVARALILDSTKDGEAAITVAAQSLGIPAELVAQVVRERDAEVSA